MYRNIPILYRILESLFRYRTLFLVSTVIITVIPGAVLINRKPSYMSVAYIQVVVEDLSAALGENNRSGGWVTVAQQNINRFNEWMKDDSPGGFVDQALRAAHLTRTINVDPRVKDMRLNAIRKALSVNTVDDTVFSITLIWDDQDECEKITKAFQQQYIERAGMDKQATSVAVVQFLDSELETYKNRIRASEQALLEFQKENVGQTPGAEGAAIDELSKLKIQLNELEVTSHNNDITREVIEKRLALIKPTSTKEQHYVESVMKDTPEVIQKNALVSKRTTLLIEGWLTTSTRVQALDTQIASLQKTIDAIVKADPEKNKIPSELVVQDNPEYRDLQHQLTLATISKNTELAQMTQLRKRIGEYEVRIERLPSATLHLNDRMRDFNILKVEYEDLLKRREQARLKTNLDKLAAITNLHALGTVYAETTGGKAKTTLMLVGLVIMGLVIGLIITILAEWADPSVRFASDIERRLGVPVLISLPDLEPLRLITSSVDGGLSSAKPLLPARNE